MKRDKIDRRGSKKTQDVRLEGPEGEGRKGESHLKGASEGGVSKRRVVSNARCQTVDAHNAEQGNSVECGHSVNRSDDQVLLAPGKLSGLAKFGLLQPTVKRALYPVRSGNGDIYRASSGSENLCPERSAQDKYFLQYQGILQKASHAPLPGSLKCELHTCLVHRLN